MSAKYGESKKVSIIKIVRLDSRYTLSSLKFLTKFLKKNIFEYLSSSLSISMIKIVRLNSRYPLSSLKFLTKF